jgi:hypothetical protein
MSIILDERKRARYPKRANSKDPVITPANVITTKSTIIIHIPTDKLVCLVRICPTMSVPPVLAPPRKTRPNPNPKSNPP